ncbi:MAG: hypothetical protein ACJ74H_18315 [Thermoanaerobaculia bacterium]
MIYRKRGSVVRWENGTLVRVIERGIAIEEGELFECRPEHAGDAPHIDETRVIEMARMAREAAGEVAIERLIVVEGIAEHECEQPLIRPLGTFSPHEGRRLKPDVAFSPPQRGEGARSADEGSPVATWTEHTQRIHLSLTRARTRVLLDLGTFDISDISRVAAALARADSAERDAPPRLRLAPNVTAALLPTLIGIAPPNVRLVQTAGGVDGYGAPIVEATGSWPNAYRPSYRVRPVRMPMQLRLECDVTEIERDRPIAVALLAPVTSVLRVLIDDGKRAYPSTVRITRIDAVSSERTWYPYGAGSFGAEMML